MTVVVSDKGWLRAMKGHLSDFDSLAFKEGDKLKAAFPAYTTDKILVFTTSGKFYTIGADRLPGGRGHGEPVRLMVDMDNDADIVTAFVHTPGRKLLVASGIGNGFVVGEDDVAANTRKGKQVMNVKMPDEARLCRFIETGEGRPAPDHVAVVGENRKLLVFALDQVPEMARGKGRAPAALQGWRHQGLAGLCFGRRIELAGFVRPHLHATTRRSDPNGSACAPAQVAWFPRGFPGPAGSADSDRLTQLQSHPRLRR